jgi:hypothetical protein
MRIENMKFISLYRYKLTVITFLWVKLQQFREIRNFIPLFSKFVNLKKRYLAIYFKG